MMYYMATCHIACYMVIMRAVTKSCRFGYQMDNIMNIEVLLVYVPV